MNPTLMYPQLLTIEPIARSSIRQDAPGEPARRITRSAAIQILAHVDEDEGNTRSPTQDGADPMTIWGIGFRRCDLDRLGYTPQDGDRITRIAGPRGQNPRAVSMYLRGMTNSGKLFSGQTLVTGKATDEAPARRATEYL